MRLPSARADAADRGRQSGGVARLALDGRIATELEAFDVIPMEMDPAEPDGPTGDRVASAWSEQHRPDDEHRHAVINSRRILGPRDWASLPGVRATTATFSLRGSPAGAPPLCCAAGRAPPERETSR
jgi:hypothetical protein